MQQDILADTPEIPVEIRIGVAQDGEALLPQKLVADPVSLLTGNVVMLGAIQLDDQLFLCNIKIYDVGTDDFLTVDHDGQGL